MSQEKENVQHLDTQRSSSDVAAEAGIDLEYEKKLIHRVDWKLLPILGALYSVALIDRTNMSNAAIAGMMLDLELYIGDRYSIALLMFFVPYFIFELPSNILLRKVGAAKWLGTIVVAWGAVMLGMGWVKTWTQLVACRTVLGFFEAGFFPACVYLVSCWYVRFEVQKRMAAFYLVSVFVGGFSAILAYGLMQMEGRHGIRGWRWIFIVEGAITLGLGILAYFVIIDFPDKVLEKKNGGFLTERDVEIIKSRIDRDRDDSVADALTWAKVGKHLCDIKIWGFSFMFLGSTVPAYAFSYFLPIILSGMGYTDAMSQILTAPPFIFATIFGMALAVVADKIRMRGPIIAFQAVVCIIGLAIVAYAENDGARYFGTFLGVAGAQGNVPAVLSYQSNNIRMNSKRSVGSALQVGFGAIGGIMASTVFRNEDKPKYINGLWTAMGCQFMILAITAATTVYFRIANKKQALGQKILENHEAFTYTY
ncbi:MFS general substrate transporter [Ascodesmis nigricans]|uniref:MFS general substrate transporter n=1 Tax=Ascodesmis nigricans TaxID=341454 RepID=A0A4S2MY28_9PEZI|nr:MFS general substrate transporter [Ascodesmis nigricans]